jgi:CHAT domain-containing protein
LEIDKIIKLIPRHCSRLVLIPHRYLHLFPLHALPLTSGELLYEKFTNGVSYAPSCQILQQVQQRERPEFQSLFAIQNPTEDLNYADLEVQTIQSYFNNSTVLTKTGATITAINNTDLNAHHCNHFSCHGYFNLTNPGKSALILANAIVADATIELNPERYLTLKSGKIIDLDRCLTLDKTFTLKLTQSRLVTLSACETGLIDFNNTSDEYIGLPSGFLLAGSPSVVSSLWTVNDLSTSFLMIQFYENLSKLDRLGTGDVAIALKHAQTWLRNLTIEELYRFWDKHRPQIEKVLAQLRKGQRKHIEESLELIKQRQPLPFANPYYWAGFTASGL